VEGESGEARSSLSRDEGAVAMLKARAGDRFVFGLSAKNIELLMEGKPILIDLKELGASNGSVMIFYGVTEAVMKESLEEAGIVLDEDKH
jgi:hypothetical protein